MRLADLIANGPGDHPHVTITNFTCGEDFVYLSRQEHSVFRSKEVGWDKVWIPLYPNEDPPREGKEPGSRPRPVRILLATPYVGARAVDVKILGRRASLDGLVTTTAASQAPDPEVRSRLKRSYPDLDFSNCLLIEEVQSHTQSTAEQEALLFTAAAAGGLGLGTVCLLVGLFLWNIDRKRSLAKAGDQGLRTDEGPLWRNGPNHHMPGNSR
jgi:hypothetical protein